MLNESNIVEVLKNLVKQTVEASNPTRIFYGTVINAKPLKINVEQRFTLSEEFLILTKNVKNYTAKTSSGSTITIYNELKKNDKVILIQSQGGQKYIVLDKVV